MAAPVEELQPVSQFWKEFGLEGRRPQYDEIGFRIAEYQEQSVQRRRQLAEATQNFRRTAESSVVSSVGELLKQYQQEIDRSDSSQTGRQSVLSCSLTKRSKYGERAFLDVYHELYEAPDPTSALESVLETTMRNAELENEVRKQAQELAEYSAESEEIRNQDATIRRLEDKARSLQTQLESKDASRDVLYQEIEEEVMEAVKGREAAMQKMVNEANEKLESVRKLHQASQDQLLVMQSKNEEMKAEYTAELEMATAEMEKAHNRVLELEAEKQRATSSTTQHTSSPDTGKNERVAHLQSLLEQQQESVTTLKAKMEAMEQMHSESQSRAAVATDALRNSLQEKEAQLDTLEKELRERPTVEAVEEMQTQLRIFQAVEYNTETPGSELPSKVDSMEALLIKKNKHLEHQLTLEKLKQAEVQQQLSDHQNLLAKAQHQLELQRDLVVRLEEDLVVAQNSSTALKTVSSTSDLEEPYPEGGSGGSMVTILRNQRDRLKQKTQELETKLTEAERQNKSIQAKADSYSADNVSLVERLRYVQGYRKDLANRADVESGLATEQKYMKQYEDRLNPFQEFQGRQRERRRKDLNLVDRTVLIVGDLVFGYKYARIFLCLYIMLLHVLVMTMLGFMSDRHHQQTIDGVEQLCLEHGFLKQP